MRPSSNPAGEPHQQLQPARRCQGDATAIEMPFCIRWCDLSVVVLFGHSVRVGRQLLGSAPKMVPDLECGRSQGDLDQTGPRPRPRNVPRRGTRTTT
jgi:hypothetical protein